MRPTLDYVTHDYCSLYVLSRISDALRHLGCDTGIVFRALLIVLASSESFAVWHAATASLSRYFVRRRVARSEPLIIWTWQGTHTLFEPSRVALVCIREITELSCL